MTSPQFRSLRRTVAGAVLVSMIFTGACSSDDGGDGSTTTAPEQKVSSDADVAAGLAKMQIKVSELLAAGPDTEKAAKADDALEPIWQTIEGTIKKNEPDIYVDIEDSMALLSAGVEGDEDKGSQGAKDIVAAMNDYLAKHPA